MTCSSGPLSTPIIGFEGHQNSTQHGRRKPVLQAASHDPAQQLYAPPALPRSPSRSTSVGLSHGRRESRGNNGDEEIILHIHICLHQLDLHSISVFQGLGAGTRKSINRRPPADLGSLVIYTLNYCRRIYLRDRIGNFSCSPRAQRKRKLLLNFAQSRETKSTMTSISSESAATVVVSCKQTRFHIDSPNYREVSILRLSTLASDADGLPMALTSWTSTG